VFFRVPSHHSRYSRKICSRSSFCGQINRLINARQQCSFVFLYVHVVSAWFDHLSLPVLAVPCTLSDKSDGREDQHLLFIGSSDGSDSRCELFNNFDVLQYVRVDYCMEWTLSNTFSIRHAVVEFELQEAACIEQRCISSCTFPANYSIWYQVQVYDSLMSRAIKVLLILTKQEPRTRTNGKTKIYRFMQFIHDVAVTFWMVAFCTKNIRT
jgi:hypothetical protein